LCLLFLSRRALRGTEWTRIEPDEQLLSLLAAAGAAPKAVTSGGPGNRNMEAKHRGSHLRYRGVARFGSEKKLAVVCVCWRLVSAVCVRLSSLPSGFSNVRLPLLLVQQDAKGQCICRANSRSRQGCKWSVKFGKFPVPFIRFFRPFSDFSGYTENGTETGCVITKTVR
jgi:hypothetical protein